MALTGRRTPKTLLLLASLAAGVSTPLQAQARGDLIAVSVAEADSLLSNVEPGTFIRLQQGADGPLVTGTFRSTSQAGVVLETTTGEVTVAYPITAAWQLTHASRRGARIGAFAGGALLAAWVFAFAEDDCSLGCSIPFALGGGLAGAGVGSLFGGAVGSRFVVWRRVLP